MIDAIGRLRIMLALLESGTYGLSALKSLIDTIDGIVDTLKAGLTVTSGTTSSNGDVGGTTVVTGLADGVDFWNGATLVIGSGTYKGQSREIIDFAGGTLTVAPAFGGQIVSAVSFYIISVRSSENDIDSIKAYVDSLETWLGDPSGDTLTTITAKLGNNTTAIGTVTDRLYSLVQATSTVTGTPTPNFFDTNLTEATDDHYNGMIIIFTSGALAGQASIIADYNGTTKEITVDPAFIETPASSDAFVIVSNAIGKLGTKSKGLDQIYDLIDQIFTMKRIGDTLTTDGTEQNLFIVDSPDFPFKPTKLLIDLTNMVAGDAIEIKEYYRIVSGGSYIKKAVYTYNDAQDPDLKAITLEPNLYGAKVTITRTLGTDRAYQHEVYYEER